MEIVVANEDSMHNLGHSLARVLAAGDVVCLHGELGAGKTTLVRGVARGKGYQGAVTSPTFALMNVYSVREAIYHFDFYRLMGQDFYDLGLEDYLEKDGICLIEWSEFGTDYLPEKALHIYIDLVAGDYERERLVRINGYGDRYSSKLKELEQIVDSGR